MEPALSSTILKFPLFLPASLEEKSAGISKWWMIRPVPSFKLKTKHLYNFWRQLANAICEPSLMKREK